MPEAFLSDGTPTMANACPESHLNCTGYLHAFPFADASCGCGATKRVAVTMLETMPVQHNPHHGCQLMQLAKRTEPEKWDRGPVLSSFQSGYLTGAPRPAAHPYKNVHGLPKA